MNIVYTYTYYIKKKKGHEKRIKFKNCFLQKAIKTSAAAV